MIRPSEASKFDVAQRAELAPGADQRFLRCVLGVGIIAENGPGGSVHGLHLPAHDLLVRRPIALAGLLDELAHRPSGPKSLPGRSPYSMRRAGRTFERFFEGEADPSMIRSQLIAR